MAPRFTSTECNGFWRSYSLLMYTLINLDVVGRALEPPQINVSYPLIWEWGGRVYGGNCKWGGSGNLDMYFFKVINFKNIKKLMQKRKKIRKFPACS